MDGYKVQAMVAVYGRLTEPWDDPAAVPGVLVMPFAGSQPAGWPPLTDSPLDGGRLWQYLERGHLADLTAVAARRPGSVYWVPGQDGRAGGWAGARIVVTERMSTDKFWLPAGVYTDRVALREGTPLWTAGQLLALPGVIDLSARRLDAVT
jgi:hypothetical protein